MATVVRVEPGKLGAVIRADGRNLSGIVKRGARRAAQKTRTRLVRQMPVDRGMLKNAWEITGFGDKGIELVNTAPYAGVIERGARPFKMPKWVIEGPLAAWVKRKIIGKSLAKKTNRQGPMTPWAAQRFAASGGFSGRGGTWEQEAINIAYAIAAKVAKRGFLGKFHVKHDLPNATRDASVEIMRAIEKYFQTRRGTPGGFLNGES